MSLLLRSPYNGTTPLSSRFKCSNQGFPQYRFYMGDTNHKYWLIKKIYINCLKITGPNLGKSCNYLDSNLQIFFVTVWMMVLRSDRRLLWYKDHSICMPKIHSYIHTYYVVLGCHKCTLISHTTSRKYL